MTDIFFSSLPCWKSKSKSPQTEVESVTVHRGWSSAMLLSGGKLLHQLNFMWKNWFSATTAGEGRSDAAAA